jgi:hypothetical protein
MIKKAIASFIFKALMGINCSSSIPVIRESAVVKADTNRRMNYILELFL